MNFDEGIHVGISILPGFLEISGKVCLKPWMLTDLRDRNTTHRVRIEESALDRHETKSWGDGTFHLSPQQQQTTYTLNLSEESRNVLVIKRKSTTQQGIQNDATGPNIDLRTSIHLSRNDLIHQQGCKHHTSGEA